MKNLIQKIVLFLFIFILIFTLYSKFILKKELIKLGGTAFLVVLTGSMEPEIMAGEMIIIQEKENYQVGDIVTYQDEDKLLITHRIIQKSSEEVILKGDHNNIADSKINQSQIQGKVIFHSKICGFFILYLLKPLTFLYIVICLLKEGMENIISEEKKECKQKKKL